MLRPNLILIEIQKSKKGSLLSVNSEAEKVRESKLGINFQDKVRLIFFSNVLNFKMIFPQINLKQFFRNNHKF